MAQLVVEIPDGVTPEEALVDFAVSLYARDRITYADALRMCGLGVWDFQQEMAKRGVGYGYELEDVERDVEAAKAVGLW
ncbi:MAG: UPF0175 family protein [Armatimonadetes bacterium]|nr:UPF0175 family protein [Armatimonadota bacterium]